MKSTPRQHALRKPYDGKSKDYQSWKTCRLQLHDKSHSTDTEPCLLSSSLTDPADRSALGSLCASVRNHGYARYQWSDKPAEVIKAVEQLNTALSLTLHDPGVVQAGGGLSLLEDKSGTDQGSFIPYTSRAMGWHTDGYYNDTAHTLRSFTLHCINPAASGGELSLLDYELILIALYDEDPELVRLLCDPQSMMLPANRDSLGHDRPDRHAAVFFINADGQLGARFTTRTQNISWRTEDTLAAAQRMAELIADNSHWHQTVRLEAGQGVITRNILHRRQAFTDDESCPRRQMLRGRYTQAPEFNAWP